MKKIAIGAFSFAIFTFIYSCKQKDYNADPSAKQWANTDDVFRQLKLQPTTITVDGSKGSTFRSGTGTVYRFYKNSFQTAGGAVTGPMEVKLTEYLKKGDMIFSRVVPMSGSKVLLTYGQVDLDAVYNGQDVSLKNDSTCMVTVPTFSVSVSDMKLYTGHPISNHYFKDVDWTLSASNGQNNIGIHSAGIDSVNIVSDQLGLLACDRLWGTDVVTCSLIVQPAGRTLPITVKVMCYALFTNANAVMGFGESSSGVAHDFAGISVPKQPLYFAAFTVIDGRFYGGTLEATPKNGETYTVVIKEVDADAFKTQLNKL